MKKVLSVIKQQRDRIEDHALHHWLVADDDGIPPETKLWFSLYFMNFIMYFRELNLYHVGYRGDSGKDLRRAALTAHADEDMTHSRLFMRDFRTLGWDELLTWQPSEVFHWLFNSEVNEQLRRRTVTIAKLYIEAQDPVVRYAVIEAIEACGNALFRHTAMVAERFRARGGNELIYWGDFHLNRETGHAVEDHEESLFASLELSAEQSDEAIRRALRAFELIDEQNTHMMELAQQTIAHGGFAHRKQPLPRVDVLPEASRTESTDGWPESYGFHFWPLRPHHTQRSLVETLLHCASSVRNDDVLRFLDVNDLDLDEAVARLRLMLLWFATDCAGTPTFYKYMVPCPDLTRPEARAINRIARQFGSRSNLLYVDWQSLELDQALAWPVSRTLEFIYLDAATESHRDMRATITHHIDVTIDPFQRYWAVVALKVMSGVYAEPYAALAKRVERELGIELPYLTLRRVALPPLDPDPEAEAVQFETFALTDEAVRRARVAIERIGAVARVRSERMLDSVSRGHYPELRGRSLRVSTAQKVCDGLESTGT